MPRYAWVLSTLCLLTQPLWGSFNVSPLTVEMQTEPDSSHTTALVVRNTGERPVSVEIKAFDFEMLETGLEKELENGTNPRGCAEWLSLSPSGLVDIDPGNVQEVRLTVNVPKGVEGTYWAKVAVIQASKPQPVRQTHGETTMQVFIRQRWEVRVHETISGTSKNEGDIVNMLVNPPAEQQSHEIALHFENTGNSLLRCTGRLELRTEDGEEVDTIALGHDGSFSVYPGTTRVLKAPLKDSLKAGHYIALAVVDFGGESLIAGELEFEKQ